MTPRTAACQAPLSSTISRRLLRFISIESVMLSNHLILWCPLLLLPSIFPSISFFSNELALHITWPKYWSFIFSITPSSELALRIKRPKYWSVSFSICSFNEYSGFISFRNDCFFFFSLQSKGLSIVFSSTTIQKHQFFSVQPSL